VQTYNKKARVHERVPTSVSAAMCKACSGRASRPSPSARLRHARTRPKPHGTQTPRRRVPLSRRSARESSSTVDLHARARRPPRATTRSHESDGTDDDLEVLGEPQLETFTPLDDFRRPMPAPAEPCEQRAPCAAAPLQRRRYGARPSVTATGLRAGLSAAVAHYGTYHYA
jgi:hypothetical protein